MNLAFKKVQTTPTMKLMYWSFTYKCSPNKYDNTISPPCPTFQKVVVINNKSKISDSHNLCIIKYLGSYSEDNGKIAGTGLIQWILYMQQTIEMNYFLQGHFTDHFEYLSVSSSNQFTWSLHIIKVLYDKFMTLWEMRNKLVHGDSIQEHQHERQKSLGVK